MDCSKILPHQVGKASADTLLNLIEDWVFSSTSNDIEDNVFRKIVYMINYIWNLLNELICDELWILP